MLQQLWQYLKILTTIVCVRDLCPQSQPESSEVSLLDLKWWVKSWRRNSSVVKDETSNLFFFMATMQHPSHWKEREWAGSAYSLLSAYRLSLTEQRERDVRQRGRVGSRRRKAALQSCTQLLCFSLLLYLFAHTPEWLGHLSDLPPLSCPSRLLHPHPFLLPSYPLGELRAAPWWRRRACWAAVVSPRVAGRHPLDLRTRTDASSSAMPRSVAITSCRPSPCQVGASSVDTFVVHSFTSGSFLKWLWWWWDSVCAHILRGWGVDLDMSASSHKELNIE